jgi:hypothetical protein
MIVLPSTSLKQWLEQQWTIKRTRTRSRGVVIMLWLDLCCLFDFYVDDSDLRLKWELTYGLMLTLELVKQYK